MDYKGDFLSLIEDQGNKSESKERTLRLPSREEGLSEGSLPFSTEGTTILAVRYKDGVVVAGDRRATSGTSVVYDRADKVIDIDEYSVMAISGSPAMAFEIARTLEHSFKYYRRSQLQEMSLEGKLRTLSRLIRDNLPLALQGIGAVIPIFAAFDLYQGEEGEGRIYFYDGLGAQFECADFSTSGSGSLGIRGALYYLNRWGEKPFVDMTRDESITLVLRMLDSASEYDTATGGYNKKSNIFPLVKSISKDGIQEISAGDLERTYSQNVEIQNK